MRRIQLDPPEYVSLATLARMTELHPSTLKRHIFAALERDGRILRVGRAVRVHRLAALRLLADTRLLAGEAGPSGDVEPAFGGE